MSSRPSTDYDAMLPIGKPVRSASPWRVLHADGDPLSREAMRLFLEFLEVDVVSTPSAGSCLDAFRNRERAFDLVVVDFETPGEDLPTLVAGIRSSCRDQPIGVTGGFPERQVFRTLPQSEAISFLRKPISVAKLRRYLRRALPCVPPKVVALTVADGPTAARWSRALEGSLELDLVEFAERAIERAEEGFPRVLLWDVGSVLPRREHLERLRAAEVPFAFWGPAKDVRAFESSGAVLVDDLDENELRTRLRALGVATLPFRVTM